MFHPRYLLAGLAALIPWCSGGAPAAGSTAEPVAAGAAPARKIWHRPAPPAPPADPAPGWWHNPHRDDAFHLYVRDSATGYRDKTSALSNAIAHAVQQLQQRISTRTAVELNGVETFAQHAAPLADGWSAWVLMRLPRAANAALLEAIAAARARLDAARSQVAAGHADQARTELQNLLLAYPVGAQSLLPSEEVAFLLSEISKSEGDAAAAADYLDQIVTGSSDSACRERAARAAASLGPISPEDRAHSRLRRLVGGRNVNVAAHLRWPGQTDDPWAAMIAKSAALLQGVGARASATSLPAAVWTRLEADPWMHTEDLLPLLGDADQLLLWDAENTAAPAAGQYQFDGRVRSVLLSRDGRRLDVATSARFGATAWLSAFLDNLANEALRDWREKTFQPPDARRDTNVHMCCQVFMADADRSDLAQRARDWVEGVLQDNQVIVLDRNIAASMSDERRLLQDPHAFITPKWLEEQKQRYRIDGVVAVYAAVDSVPAGNSYFTATAQADLRLLMDTNALADTTSSHPMGRVGNPASVGATALAAETEALQRALADACERAGFTVAPAQRAHLPVRLEASDHLPAEAGQPALSLSDPAWLASAWKSLQPSKDEAITFTGADASGSLGVIATYIEKDNITGTTTGSRLHLVDLASGREVNNLVAHAVSIGLAGERHTRKVLACAFLDDWRHLLAVTGNAVILYDTDSGQESSRLPLPSGDRVKLFTGHDAAGAFAIVENKEGPHAYRMAAAPALGTRSRQQN